MALLDLSHSRFSVSEFSSNPEGEAYVCWSRMQAEAGQPLDAIVARKEQERQAGNGVFLWGVGNAPSTSIKPLARLKIPVPVVFSEMKSKPKIGDTAPGRTVLWRRYVDENGIERDLPESALVTSKGDSLSGAKTRHYALMCYSKNPLTIARGTIFDPLAYRNAGGAGAPVGASQVTALLKQIIEPSSKSNYEANIVAWLTHGYWVRLSDPREINAQAIKDINDFYGDSERWMRFVKNLRGKALAQPSRITQNELFA